MITTLVSDHKKVKVIIPKTLNIKPRETINIHTFIASSHF